METKNRKLVDPEIAKLINKLQTLLYVECGADFSYSIMGNGKIIAASNMIDGIILPLAKVPPLQKS